MNPTMCLVCNDKKKYEMKVHDVKNIISQLKRYISNNVNKTLDGEDYEILRQWGMHNQHSHFMCGRCYKVNTMELTNLERDMDVLLVSIAKEINKDSLIFHKVLHLLNGRYSRKYQIFRQFVLKN